MGSIAEIRPYHTHISPSHNVLYANVIFPLEPTILAHPILLLPRASVIRVSCIIKSQKNVMLSLRLLLQCKQVSGFTSTLYY